MRWNKKRKVVKYRTLRWISSIKRKMSLNRFLMFMRGLGRKFLSNKKVRKPHGIQINSYYAMENVDYLFKHTEILTLNILFLSLRCTVPCTFKRLELFRTAVCSIVNILLVICHFLYRIAPQNFIKYIICFCKKG